MKKNNIMKNLWALALLAATFAFTGCNNDDDGDAAPEQTLMELIDSETGGAEGLDSLSKYLNNYPDLVSVLNADDDKTIFAPTNAAFINLLQTPGFPQDIEDINPEIIKGVLAYHVVPNEEVQSSELVANATFNTAYTDQASSTVQTITVNSDGTLLTGATNQSIEIVEADLSATNGILHKVESVLIPPSVGQTLTPILGTMAGTALLAANFSHLADLIAVADSEVPEGETPVAGILASSGSYTAFFPPNQVFEQAAQQNGVDVEDFINSFDPTTARAILLTHVITSESVSINGFTNGKTYTAGSDVQLSVTVEDTPTNSPTGVFVSSPGTTNAPIVQGDINHSNGIVHVIGGILLPTE